MIPNWIPAAGCDWFQQPAPGVATMRSIPSSSSATNGTRSRQRNSCATCWRRPASRAGWTRARRRRWPGVRAGSRPGGARGVRGTWRRRGWWCRASRWSTSRVRAGHATWGWPRLSLSPSCPSCCASRSGRQRAPRRSCAVCSRATRRSTWATRRCSDKTRRRSSTVCVAWSPHDLDLWPLHDLHLTSCA